MPRFRPVPLPIRTFRQAFDSGRGLRIHCPGCHGWRPIDLTAEQLDNPFAAGPRFVCGHLKLKVYGDGREACGRTGEPVFRPLAPPDPDRTVVDLECSGAGRGRSHARWEINGIDLKAPPWDGLLRGGQRFSCPGCGGMARHTYRPPYPRRPREPAGRPSFS